VFVLPPRSSLGLTPSRACKPDLFRRHRACSVFPIFWRSSSRVRSLTHFFFLLDLHFFFFWYVGIFLFISARFLQELTSRRLCPPVPARPHRLRAVSIFLSRFSPVDLPFLWKHHAPCYLTPRFLSRISFHFPFLLVHRTRQALSFFLQSGPPSFGPSSE